MSSQAFLNLLSDAKLPGPAMLTALLKSRGALLDGLMEHSAEISKEERQAILHACIGIGHIASIATPHYEHVLGALEMFVGPRDEP